MGESFAVRLFREPDADRFRATMARVLEEAGGSVRWNAVAPPDDPAARQRKFVLAHRPGTQSLFIPFHSNGEDYFLSKVIAVRLAVPWIEVRIQCGHWDYTLCDRDVIVDHFSTLPQYWEPDDKAFIAARRGKPRELARLWNVPVNQIDRYLQNWGFTIDGDAGEDGDDDGDDVAELDAAEAVLQGMFDIRTYRATLSGKAYDTDRHEYGDQWQMLDFLHALGGCQPVCEPYVDRSDPYMRGDNHMLVMPPADRLKQMGNAPLQ